MMLILERYIARIIILATAFSILIFTSILFLVTLLTEMRSMGEGDYGIVQAIVFVLMRLPAELYQFTPILLLLGSIAGLSVLSSSKEISVMRTAGFSIKKIMKSVFGATFALLLLFGVLGEFWAPKLSYDAEMHKQYAKNAGQAVVTTAGIWLHVGNNFIHIENIIDQKLLEGVTRYQFDSEHRLQAAYYAKTLSYKNHQWVMNDVVKTMFYKDRTKNETLAHSPWDITFNMNLLNPGLVDASGMSLPRLIKYSNFLEKNGLQASEYKYELWQRLFQPLAAMVMVFLALPFVLGTFNTSSLGWRMVVGILVGFAFFILKACLAQLCIVYQIPAMLAALLPLLFFSFIGVYLFRKLVTQ